MYCLALIIGILSGYICLEKLEFACGIGLLLTGGVFLIGIKRDALEGENNDRKLIFAVILLGFLLFSIKYIELDNSVSPNGDEILGRVESVQTKDNVNKIVLITLGDNSLPDHTKIAVTSYKSEDPEIASSNLDEIKIVPGDIVSCSGIYKEASRQENPHCFDYRLYLLSKGVRYCFRADLIKVVGMDDRLHSKIMRYVYAKRVAFESSIKEDDIRAFIKGVIFGDKSEIDDSIIEDFNSNSTGHILAVSGLHIGFIYVLLNALTKKRKTFGIAIVMIVVLLLYGEMTMWSASTVRAVLVMSTKLLSTFLKRSFDMLSSVSAVAMLLLIVNPYQLFNTGFQMSFIAVLGIAFIAPFLAFWIGDSLAMLVAVQLAVAPYTIYVFHRFNILSIFINIAVVFIASVLVPICIVGLMMECALGGCPGVLIEIISGITELLVSLNHWLTFDNAFAIDVCSPRLVFLLGFYAVCLIGCSEWTRVRLIRKRHVDVMSVLGVAFAAILVISAAFNGLDKSDVIFVSVGQGDCTHIRTRSSNVLIDGGGAREFNVGAKTLKPYLLSNRADSVDYAITTHLHMDHFKGLTELSEERMVDNLLIPSIARDEFEAKYSDTDHSGEENSDTENSVTEGNGSVKFLDVGDRVNLSDEIYIETIWPKNGSVAAAESGDDNEINMVYMVNYMGVKIMVTGDIPSTEEEKMVEFYRGSDKLKCDILKVAHHGSKGSSLDIFLDEARPTVAVISVGKNNMYGHPNDEALAMLEARGIKVYRTDENGAVGVDIRRGRRFEIESMI